jgi:hypothetical protein
MLDAPLRTTAAPDPGNPFLNFDTSLTATADFLARSLTSDASAKELKTMGVTEPYTAKLADNAMGPFLSFTVTGTQPEHVKQSTQVIVTYAQRKLAKLQQDNGAPTNTLIRTAVIVPPQTALPQLKKKLELVAGAGGGGLVFAFVATFLTDSLARLRRRSRPAAPAPEVRQEPADMTAEIRLPAFAALDRRPEASRTGVGLYRSSRTTPSQRRAADPVSEG